VTANTAGIGATVKVEAGGETWLRYVEGGSGKGGQDSLYLHFGVGSATSIDLITVNFPGGNSVAYTGPFAVDQRLWLFENSTIPVASWAKP
jgi:hypothetical protein